MKVKERNISVILGSWEKYHTKLRAARVHDTQVFRVRYTRCNCKGNQYRIFVVNVAPFD